MRGRRLYGRLAVYGNVRMIRDYCPVCNDLVLFPRGKSACCGFAPLKAPGRWEVVVPPHRRHPSQTRQDALLLEFGNGCAYCRMQFGTLVEWGKRRAVLRLVWDHFIPFIATGDSSDENFRPACQLCNGLKRDRLFQSLEEAQGFVARSFDRKGVREVRDELPPE